MTFNDLRVVPLKKNRVFRSKETENAVRRFLRRRYKINVKNGLAGDSGLRRLRGGALVVEADDKRFRAVLFDGRFKRFRLVANANG